MTAPARSPLFRVHPFFISVMAGLIGFVVNGAGLTVVGHSEFVAGNVFSLLVAALYGPWWGALSAAMAYSRIWLIWDHWFALAIMTLEAVAVCFWVRRGKQLLFADALFWQRWVIEGSLNLDALMEMIDHTVRFSGRELLVVDRHQQLLLSSPGLDLSPLEMSSDRETCIEAGARAYFSKPYDMKDLLVAMAGLLPDLVENDPNTRTDAP